MNVALQVAGIAAQVTSALQANDSDRCDELESKLALAQSHLDPLDAPPGLVPFIDVMRGVLRGDDVSARAGGLPPSYRAVYEQVVDSIQNEPDEGELTVREVMDQMANNVIAVMQAGTFDQRQQMVDVLFKMQQESEQRPHLAPLADLAQAARILIEGGDPSAIVSGLPGPYRERWDRIALALEID
ncbi:MAG: hypothetical protein JXA89_00180 [Anaerolineae bacterium]|nr:hypothetical protein [Anaerolineae bacterium]